MEEIKQWFYQPDAIVGQSDLLFVIIKLEEYFRGTDYVKQAYQAEIDQGLTTEEIGKTPALPESEYNRAGMYKVSYDDTTPLDGDLGIYVNGRSTAVYFDKLWWFCCSTNSDELDRKIPMEAYRPGLSGIIRSAWRFKTDAD